MILLTKISIIEFISYTIIIIIIIFINNYNYNVNFLCLQFYLPFNCLFHFLLFLSILIIILINNFFEIFIQI